MQTEETIMSKSDVARREFLAGAALGAGVVVGAKLLPEASGATNPQHVTADIPAPAHMHANGEGMVRSSMTPMPNRWRHSPNA